MTRALMLAGSLILATAGGIQALGFWPETVK
jgi:hypothetical protein